MPVVLRDSGTKREGFLVLVIPRTIDAKVQWWSRSTKNPVGLMAIVTLLGATGTEGQGTKHHSSL